MNNELIFLFIFSTVTVYFGFIIVYKFSNKYLDYVKRKSLMEQYNVIIHIFNDAKNSAYQKV